MAEVIDRSTYGPYKYQWARYAARKALVRDSEFVKRAYSDASQHSPSGFPPDLLAGVRSDAANLELRDIARDVKHLTFGKPPDKDGEFHMGIVGSGVSGLFTALLIDELNKRYKGTLNITYDILEATASKRLGGRLYTHRFTKEPTEHQYYDVGAMRFPKNEVMERTFRLFDFLGMKSTGDKPDLIPYYLLDDKKVCPKYFNDIRVFGDPGFKKRISADLKDSKLSNVKDAEEVDPFQVNKWLPPNDPNRISRDVIDYDPNDIIDKAIEPLTKKLRDDLDAAAKKTKDRTDPIIDGRPDEGWKILNEVDFLSTRQFFRTKGEIGSTGIDGCGYNFNTIEWLETYAYATGWYNQSLAETVLEALDFDPPKGNPPSNKYWYCVEGGTQLVAEKMAAQLTEQPGRTKQPEFNKQVTAIETDLNKGDIKLTIKTTKPDDWDPTKPFKAEVESRSYFTVFNSTTLGALQRMDLSKANLLYGTKQAIRSLNYGASCKIGIQFAEMWWMDEPWNIDQGGVARTDLPIRVCVYPSYNIHDPKNKRGVLLCSYSWAQDAQRIGTLIDPRSPNNEDELKELLLSNLAQLHAKPEAGWPSSRLLDHLHKLYITHHAYDWYHDPNMAGAFAYFGPGQFSQMWPEIIKPNGWLFLIGEAASAHHGWIVGALESSVRAVYQLLFLLDEQVLKEGRRFSGYAKAMEFLAGPKGKPDDPDWQLPFVGLPREIPVRQEGTEKGKEEQETPEKDNVDLSFIAAQCITSFFEMAIEVANEERLKA